MDRERCVGCQICMNACPKQVITVQIQPRVFGEAVKKVKVDIDGLKCNFCGVCDITCPYGAIKVFQNGNSSEVLLVLAKDSYPQIMRDIGVDTRKCDKACVKCESVCPLKLIKISKVGYDGKPVEDISVLSPLGQKRVQVTLDIQKEFCPTCRLCEFSCALGAVKVKKIFEGHLLVDQEKCLVGCRDCVDVCPITGTLVFDDNGKVVANEQSCTFCGACKNVCPNPEALTVQRTKVQHTPVHSGAWNKTLERLTSPQDAMKEFKAHAAQARRTLVKNRLEFEARKKNE
ncbi:MAG: 4Fe-4S dicluster domain-containing protein [Nitrososphaerota archaeon]|nr:4Fe-4S dicluster domain-containing protein [Nitrososphaerota archaeon]